jgi:hypothetical protein
MKLLYYAHAAWEFDYIKNDLFKNSLDYEHVANCDITLLLNRKEELYDKCVLVINVFNRYDNIMTLASTLRPRIILLLSDEAGDRSYYLNVATYTHLLLHQYRHAHITYPPNSKQIPLGYITRYLKGRCSLDLTLHPLNKRSITCSFIGALKSDRPHMLGVFLQNIDRVVYKSAEPEEMFSVYSDSIFVPNGRGNCTLDCLRLYEAMVAGAIPVIVGQLDEIRSTFYYDGNMPPFIIESSWEAACHTCKLLLTDTDALLKHQTRITTWWRNVMGDIYKRIEIALS